MFDAAGLEVFRHRITAVAEAMGATLQRAACSPNIKERLDFSCAVFDRHGRLLAQAAHIPVHLGAMPASVAAARTARAAADGASWQPGDVVILNDPYQGGSHLPDITSVSPVFAPVHAPGAAREPTFFIASRAHHADVGGAAPGSLAPAYDLQAEGLIIPPVRLVRAGAIDPDLLAVICANSRTPDERRGDLEAQLAAHHVGTERLIELLAAGADDLAAAGDGLLAYSERRARAGLLALPDGSYPYADQLDDDGRGAGPIEIAVTVAIDRDQLVADFSGTAPQTAGGVNCPLAVTESAVYYAVACLLGDVPINAGAFAPVRVVAPPGSLLNPYPPAAVAAGNVETSQRVVDVVLGALAAALPERIPAASQGTMNNVTIGGFDPLHRRPFSYYETLGGGGGGGPDGAGASGLQVHMTNTRNTPVEALETSYPLRVEAYRLRRGSGGRGRHPGGDGIERRLRFLAPARIALLTERRTSAPRGLSGGESGAPGQNRLIRVDAPGIEQPLPAKGSFDVAAGDVLVIRTPGGGGWGAGSGRGGDRLDGVENHKEHDPPGRDVEQQQPVAQEDLLGRAAHAPDVDQVEVAEHRVEDEGNRQQQEVG
jgi:N-methylhydantoinase B